LPAAARLDAGSHPAATNLAITLYAPRVTQSHHFGRVQLVGQIKDRMTIGGQLNGKIGASGQVAATSNIGGKMNGRKGLHGSLAPTLKKVAGL